MDIFGRKRIAELEDELEKIGCSKDRLEKYVNEYERVVESLNNSIKSLTDEINAKVSDCKVGEWCKDCKYHSVARMGSLEGIKEIVINPWLDLDAKYSKYYYCSKHLREICPEFKKDEEE